MVMNKIINIFIVVLLIAVVFAIALALLSMMSVDMNDACCKENNASYVFFECQCSTALNFFNGYDACENLTCGSFCQFSDGDLKKTTDMECEINNVTVALT
jgi:hypothetical protein